MAMPAVRPADLKLILRILLILSILLMEIHLNLLVSIYWLFIGWRRAIVSRISLKTRPLQVLDFTKRIWTAMAHGLNLSNFRHNIRIGGILLTAYPKQKLKGELHQTILYNTLLIRMDHNFLPEFHQNLWRTHVLRRFQTKNNGPYLINNVFY